MVRVDLTESETVEQQVNVGQPEEPGGQRPQARSSKGARVLRGQGSVVDRRPPGGLGFPLRCQPLEDFERSDLIWLGILKACSGSALSRIDEWEFVKAGRAVKRQLEQPDERWWLRLDC